MLRKENLFLVLGMLISATAQQPFGIYPGSLQNLLNTVGMPPFQIPARLEPSNDPTVNINYTFTDWSPYQSCDKACGGGMMERSRNCLSESGTMVPISMCVATNDDKLTASQLMKRFLRGTNLDIEVQHVPCNTQKCKTVGWNAWAVCSKPCGGGTQTSTTKCSDNDNQSLCNFQKSRTRACNTHNCYERTEWTEWGKCSKACSGGTQDRKRSCTINPISGSHGYNSMKNVLQLMLQYGTSVPPWMTMDKHYLDQYRETCDVPKVETSSCNEEPCSLQTVCPGNQKMHSCMPCVKHCNPYSSNNALSWYDTVTYMSGCNLCVPGCACPQRAPFLGLDNNCYSIQSMCPHSAISTNQEPRLRIGSNSSPLPTTPETTTTTAATTTTTAATTTTTAATTTTTAATTTTTAATTTTITTTAAPITIASGNTAAELQWNEWSECDRVCGGGTQYTTHKCLKTEDCSGSFFKERACNTHSCYQPGEWSEWSDCSHDGIGCSKNRKRSCEPTVQPDRSEYYGLVAAKEWIQQLKSAAPSAPGATPPVFIRPSGVMNHYVQQYQMCEKETLSELSMCYANQCGANNNLATGDLLPKCQFGILQAQSGKFDCACDQPIHPVPCVNPSDSNCGICLSASLP